MAKIKAENSDSLKSESKDASSKGKKSHESKSDRNDRMQQSNEDTTSIKREKDASKTEDQNEWRAARHPRLPNTTPPRYLVNKQAVVCSNLKGKLKPLKLLRKNETPYYNLATGKNKGTTIKLEEIMVYTFSDQEFDKDTEYIIHKDGDKKNCAWDNLAVYDLATLQEEEICRLFDVDMDTDYTVVRNVHDTRTFERYLVSDAGDIYSLIKRRYLRTFEDERGCPVVHLYSDRDAERGTPSVGTTLKVHHIVLQSFQERREEGIYMIHRNCDISDASLDNLTYANPHFVHRIQALEPRFGMIIRPKKTVPLPPVTTSTRWKTIGVLPWNGLSFNQYEVSNLGHVRHKNKSKVLKPSCSIDGYALVSLTPTNQDSESRPKSLRVARLVANAFVAGYSEKNNVVAHLNGDRLDNRAWNLEWASMQSASVHRRARPVLAGLVENPMVQKEFPSMAQASRELRTSFSGRAVAPGNTFIRNVNWDGEKKRAYIQVSLSSQESD